MCYANRRGATYVFSDVPAPSTWNYRFDPGLVWTAAESGTVKTLLDQLPWWDTRLCTDEVLREAIGVELARNYCASDRLFVYVRNPRPGAMLRIRLPVRMSGAFIDASTGQEVERVSYGGNPGEMWELAVPGPRSSLVLMLKQAK